MHEHTASEYQMTKYKDSHYMCPVYVNFLKNRVVNVESSEGQMICTIPIPVMHRKPQFWIKRNVSILCYLDDEFDVIAHQTSQ